MIGSYADVDPNLVVALYFTSAQLVSSNPDLVQRFTEAMQESLAYADAHPDEVRADHRHLHPDHRRRSGPR